MNRVLSATMEKTIPRDRHVQRIIWVNKFEQNFTLVCISFAAASKPIIFDIYFSTFFS